MSRKGIAIVLIVGLGLIAAIVLRTANRADAAAGDCYSDSKGPSEPTVCE